MVLQNLSISGENDRCFASSLTNKEPAEIVHLLRERDQRLYSLAMLAELLGLSKATVHRLTKKEGENNGD